MEKDSSLSHLFSKTIELVKRQTNRSLIKHNSNCWLYYLKNGYKYYGCESSKFTHRKLTCEKRSKSFESFLSEENNKFRARSKSVELISRQHIFNLELKNIYNIKYNCECNY